MLLKYILKVYKYAIKVYKDPERSLIRSENKGKIGVYAWVNTINNKLYIGSGNPFIFKIK
jgi:hypothetical protein